MKDLPKSLQDPYRIFFSIDLPQETIPVLNKLIEQIKKNNKINASKKSSPLHITLQFFAAIEKKDISALVSLIRQVLKEYQSFELELNEIELFPNKSHPRIVSLVPQPHEILSALAQCIGKVMVDYGYEIEHRAFRAHVTLLRINKKISLENIVLPKIQSIRVNEIFLYRSQLLHGVYQHILLERFSLKK